MDNYDYKDEIRFPFMKQLKKLNLNGFVKINGDNILIFSDQYDSIQESISAYKKDLNILTNNGYWIDYYRCQAPEQIFPNYCIEVNILKSIK